MPVAQRPWRAIHEHHQLVTELLHHQACEAHRVGAPAVHEEEVQLPLVVVEDFCHLRGVVGHGLCVEHAQELHRLKQEVGEHAHEQRGRVCHLLKERLCNHCLRLAVAGSADVHSGVDQRFKVHGGPLQHACPGRKPVVGHVEITHLSGH